MGGLNHDFLLISVKENPSYGWENYFNRDEAIQIHDDILSYMADTIKWIPSYNPSKKCPYNGLCWYGPTIIKQEGATIAQKVFSLWAELFSCGPTVLKLTGNFSCQLDNDPFKDGYERIVPNSSGYEKLIINRNELVDKLKLLSSYAQKIQDSYGQFYILHMGI